MNDYKFVCPVCGQHIKCDTSYSGRLMDCPTCFQKIIAPQAPDSPNPNVILKGTKVGDRPAVSVTAGGTEPGRAKSFPVVVGIAIAVVCAGVAAVFMLRGTSSKTAKPPAAPMVPADSGNPSPPSAPPQAPALPPPDTTQALPRDGQYWTLNLDSVRTPNSAAVGSIHGITFVATYVVLDKAYLTLRTPEYPPRAGVTIFLPGATSADVAGKTVIVRPETPGALWVNLRYKDADGNVVEDIQKNGGYAMRLELGQIVNDQVAGRIYLCTGDAEKSYVVGSFVATVKKQP